jgi:FKBP-type peptidyl-prolyl cis-trans isomerase FkpA
MKLNLFFSLLCVLLVAGCASEGRRIKADSGYEYEVVRKGSSDPIPVNSYIFFNMSVTHKDSVLQSSATMGQPSIVKVMDDNKSYGQLGALVDIMAGMHLGDSLHFYFPLDSFERKPPGFENFTDPIVYRVGIIDIKDEAQYQAHTDSIQAEMEKDRQLVRDRLPEIEALTKSNWEAYKKGDFDALIQTTDSGLKYLIHELGDGPKPERGEQVTVHYYGMLDADAKMFDTSFRGGQPYQFPLGMGQVIQGWDEGILLLNKGSKATLFIPPSLGYGAAGSPGVIPENAALIFYVEVEK